MHRKATARIGTVLCIAVLTLVGWPATAAASGGADVSVLLTEVVEDGISDRVEPIQFWWSDPDTPRWTVSDEYVFEGLRSQGLDPAAPTEVNISRIYRRPGLSTANAAQLGALLDTNHVLVGEIQFFLLGPVAPLFYRGVGARAEVQLVPAGDTDGVELDRFTINRRAFGDDVDEVFEQLRRETARALGELMGRSLRRVQGEIGTVGYDNIIAVRNVGRADRLEAIRTHLLELDEVDRVVERWASEGIIALQIDVKGADFAYVRRVLEGHQFDEFELVAADGETVEGVPEYWIQAFE